MKTNLTPETLTKLPTIGTRVQMISENSNWIVGEKGTVVWTADDGRNQVAIEFDGREDDYSASSEDFKTL